MKKLRRILFLFLITALLAVGFLLSPAGLRLLTPRLEAFLSERLQAAVHIDGLRLDLPLTLRLKEISLLNEDGEGILLESLRVRVSITELLRGRVLIRRLNAAGLRMSSLAFGPERERPQTREPLFIPAWDDVFGALRVDRLDLASVRLNPPLVAEALNVQLSARLQEEFLSSEIRAEDFPNFGTSTLGLRVYPEGSRWSFSGRLQTSETDVEIGGGLEAETRTAELRLRIGVPHLLADQRLAELNLSTDLDSLDTLLELQMAPVSVLGRELVLLETLRAEWAGGRVRIQPFTLQYGAGILRARGETDFDQVDLQADVLDLPLELFGLAGVTHPGARLQGDVSLQGPLEKPEVSIRLDFQGLRPESDALWDGTPARFLVASDLREGRWSSTFRLEDLPGDPAVLELELPLELSLRPFKWKLPQDQNIRGHFTARTELAGLARLFVLDVYHRFSGAFVADFGLNGTLAEPFFRGAASLRDGRYEHELHGILLRELSLELGATRDELVLESLRARDGGRGRMEWSGRMRLSPPENFPFTASLKLDQFRFLNSDTLRVQGEGDLAWEGTRAASRLTGALRLSPVEVNLPERVPPALTPLAVTEIHAETPEELPEPPPKVRRHDMNFDVRLDAPERVFVRGNGLDSEWSARLRLQGDLDEPRLVGWLEVLRGRFIFFGKRLLITRGVVQLDGAYPPEPVMDLSAELRSGGILGVLSVQGPIDNPEISLSSTPMLPEDEILARLLFGRESARISPWQALTLAQALNRLRGGGSAFDLTGETRRILRVDQVDVRTADEQSGETSITLGKYISDRIYVEVERGIGAEGGRATVEVELTPTLRLETEAGANADTGIGIIWTRDF